MTWKGTVLFICFIILLTFYASLIQINIPTPIQEGLSLKKVAKKATKKDAVSDMTSKLIKKSETKMLKQMETLIKKSNEPLKKQMNTFKNSLESIVKTIFKQLKQFVVNPIVQIFQSMGKVFVLLSGLFMLVMEKFIHLPRCLLSYTIWTLNTIRIQIFDLIVPLILKTLLNAIFPEIIAKTIHSVLLYLGNLVVIFFIAFANFFGLTNLFYEPTCFDFTSKSQNIFNKISNIVQEIPKSFEHFGKF
jgi:hypothetical protein